MGRINGKHENLVSIVYQSCLALGLDPVKHKTYRRGEMDVYANGYYFEVKCSASSSSVSTAKKQIRRAIRHGQCRYGYLITYTGVYDVLSNTRLIYKL